MEPVRDRRWVIARPDTLLVDQLARECSISRLSATVLVNRGISRPEDARNFLSSSLANLHDPFLLLDMEKAVERISMAVASRERICVYGDYDVDGVTSVALLTSFLRSLGADCVYHVPNRVEEGYGLSEAGITAVSRLGARLVITADCGISAFNEAEICASRGIDLIITDHHTPSERVPSALAVINPLRPGCPFPCKTLAGVGVAFNLAMALRSRLRDEGFFAGVSEPNLRSYLDLVALGTIADLVPLVGENRILVVHGLRELTAALRTGVKALKEVAGIKGDVDCGAVGFRLAPRLNAAGRLEDAATGIELLLTSDGEKAAVLAAELDASNEERQCLEQMIFREALDRLRSDPDAAFRKSIVLASESWHCGVIGIVASRIVDIFHRPTILISLEDGSGKGSGRSIPGFHLHDALHACSEHILRFGGHKYAAGLTIERDTLEAFAARFDAIAAELLAPEDLVPEIRIDAELAPDQLTLRTAEEMALLEPFGMGNPRPLFLVRGAKVRDRNILKEKHVRLRIDVNGVVCEALGFNMADSIPVSDHIDAVCSLDVNEWNCRRSLRLRLRDAREAGEQHG